MTLEAARNAVLDEFARRDPFGGRGSIPAEVGASHDAPAALRERMAEGLAARVLGREFRAMPVVDMMRTLLDVRGERGIRSASRAQVVDRAIPGLNQIGEGGQLSTDNPNETGEGYQVVNWGRNSGSPGRRWSTTTWAPSTRCGCSAMRCTPPRRPSSSRCSRRTAGDGGRA